jgi:hypothetical protein
MSRTTPLSPGVIPQPCGGTWSAARQIRGSRLIVGFHKSDYGPRIFGEARCSNGLQIRRPVSFRVFVRSCLRDRASAAGTRVTRCRETRACRPVNRRLTAHQPRYRRASRPGRSIRARTAARCPGCPSWSGHGNTIASCSPSGPDPPRPQPFVVGGFRLFACNLACSIPKSPRYPLTSSINRMPQLRKFLNAPIPDSRLLIAITLCQTYI